MMTWNKLVVPFLVGVPVLFCLTPALSFAFVPNNGRSQHTLDTALSVSFSADEAPEYDHRRLAEFQDLEPVVESDARRKRKKQDKRLRGQYAKHGDDLWALRKLLEELSQKLVKAINNESHEKEQSIREKIRQLEAQDPELVYKMELMKMNKARIEDREEDAAEHSKNAMDARSQLPHYNLEGLWVGKYGQHGYELINVTYSGDTLIAYKLTGDKNVPRGEITFQASLDPFPPKAVGSKASKSEPLQPISLTEKAAKKWGTSLLPRYKGLGQVAESGFNNNQWMDGQLIIIGEEYFSFAWVPIEQQIFFGRPSPELALKMLRESSAASVIGVRTNWEGAPPSMDDDVHVLKQYVASCLERTKETVDEEFAGDAFSCIWHGDTEECYFE